MIRPGERTPIANITIKAYLEQVVGFNTVREVLKFDVEVVLFDELTIDEKGLMNADDAGACYHAFNAVSQIKSALKKK